jgi:hypothetical protein
VSCLSAAESEEATGEMTWQTLPDNDMTFKAHNPTEQINQMLKEHCRVMN